MNGQGLVLIAAGVALFATVLLRAAFAIHNLMASPAKRLPAIGFPTAVLVSATYAVFIVFLFVMTALSFQGTSVFRSFWPIFLFCEIVSLFLLPTCLMMFGEIALRPALRLTGVFLCLVSVTAAALKVIIDIRVP